MSLWVHLDNAGNFSFAVVEPNDVACLSAINDSS